MKNGSFSRFGIVKIRGDVEENGYNFLSKPTKIHSSKWREKGKEKIIFEYILSFCSYFTSKFFFSYNFLSSLSSIAERKIKTISIPLIFYFIFMFLTFTLIFLN